MDWLEVDGWEEYPESWVLLVFQGFLEVPPDDDRTWVVVASAGSAVSEVRSGRGKSCVGSAGGRISTALRCWKWKMGAR